MDDIQVFAGNVAAHLPGWELVEDDRGYTLAHLVNAEIPGAKIYFRLTHRRGRVEISGGYPHGFYPYHGDEPRIGVGMARPAEAVARDICQRFLDEYLACFREAMEAAYQAAQGRAKMEDFADELAAILESPVRCGQDSCQVSSAHGTFTIAHGSGGVYVSMQRIYSLTPELAKEMAQLFARG